MYIFSPAIFIAFFLQNTRNTQGSCFRNGTASPCLCIRHRGIGITCVLKTSFLELVVETGYIFPCGSIWKHGYWKAGGIWLLEACPLSGPALRQQEAEQTQVSSSKRTRDVSEHQTIALQAQLLQKWGTDWSGKGSRCNSLWLIANSVRRDKMCFSISNILFWFSPSFSKARQIFLLEGLKLLSKCTNHLPGICLAFPSSFHSKAKGKRLHIYGYLWWWGLAWPVAHLPGALQKEQGGSQVPGQVGKDNTSSACSGCRKQAEVHMGGEQDHQTSPISSNIPQIR